MPAGAFSAAKIAPQGFSAAKIMYFAEKSAKTGSKGRICVTYAVYMGSGWGYQGRVDRLSGG